MAAFFAAAATAASFLASVNPATYLPEIKIPSVILLLVLGVCVRLAADFFKVVIPDLTPILPVIGTIGLILIVLEGSLELEIKKENLGLIRKSAIVAFVPILVLSFLIVYTN